MDAPPSVRSLGAPTESGKPMPHACREPPGALHCPKSLDARLKAGVDGMGQAVRSTSYFCNRENHSTCRRPAHVRNGLSIDSIRTRHQLLDLVSAPPCYRRCGRDLPPLYFIMSGAVQFAWRRGKTAQPRI